MLLKQIAGFALVAPLSMGCLMADEVGDQDDCCLYPWWAGRSLESMRIPCMIWGVWRNRTRSMH